MSLREELTAEIRKILEYNLNVTRCDNRVPTKDDLTLGETAKLLETAVLFTDVRNSSVFAESHWQKITAKTYNAFLNCALRIIKSNAGEVRSFNGDSLLAFFTPGDSACKNAVMAAMQLNWALRQLLRPEITRKRYATNFNIGIGVSYGKVMCTKVGIKRDENNDLIWPGTPTNLAAKLGGKANKNILCDILISQEVWDATPAHLKLGRPLPPLLLPRLPHTVHPPKLLWSKYCIPFAGSFITAYGTKSTLSIN